MSLVLSEDGGTGRLASWPVGRLASWHRGRPVFWEKTQMMGSTINVEQSTWGKLEVLGDFFVVFF